LKHLRTVLLTLLRHAAYFLNKIDGVEADGENRNAPYSKMNWFVQTNDLPCNIRPSPALHFQFSGIREAFVTADASWMYSSDIVDLAFIFLFEQIKGHKIHCSGKKNSFFIHYCITSCGK